jgi:hypothetical protein
MSDELMTQSLLWANLAIERIDRALRQMKRLQKAYAALCVEEDRLRGSDGYQQPMPKSWTDLKAVFDDHLYFFIIAARQAVKAAWVLEQRGETMPRIRQGEVVRSWRDFEEHWDAPARGQPHKAKEKWQTYSDEEEPGLTLGGVGDKLKRVSGVRLPRLRKDLKAARKAAAAVSDRESNDCYITAAEAAEILSMTLEEFESQPSKPIHMDFGGEDGVRYWRGWVEARRDGRPIPPGWAPYVNVEFASDDPDSPAGDPTGTVPRSE